MDFASYAAAVAKILRRFPASFTSHEISQLASIWRIGGHDVVSLGVNALRRGEG